MNKLLLKFFILFFGIFLFGIENNITIASTSNIEITTENTGVKGRNNQLEQLEGNGSEFFAVDNLGEKGLRFFILNIARDLKIFIYSLLILIGVIMVIRLIFSEKTEEEQKKLKSGILWVSIGIIVTQTAFNVYPILFDKEINASLARNFTNQIIQPFLNLLLLLASFIFIVTAFIGFYKIVTSDGDEKGMEEAKKSIFYAIIGFIVIKFSKILVVNTFTPDCGTGGTIIFGGSAVCQNITENEKIISTLINWLNSFVTIILVIMIIYAGFLFITSGGEEEKQKKAKNILLYIAIGVIVLIANYIIFTFFIKP